MGSVPPPAIAGDPAAPGSPERFDELLLRLRALVERLEGGHISLEDGLRCFEEGMTLCKRGAEILDQAERRVEVLLGAGQRGTEGVRTAPFEAPATARETRDENE